MLETLNDLPQMNMDTSETGCCARFESAPWDYKLMNLSGLPMVKASTRSLFYIPMNMDKVMTTTLAAISEANASVADRYLVLSKDVSPWRCNHYFLVKNRVPSLENLNFSGTFITRAFEGDYGQISKWIPDLKSTIAAEGKTMKSLYAFYTTCPKCAKYYGKNPVVLFGEI